VPQSYAEEAGWLRKAAGRGAADAQFALGILYCNGRGVARDLVEGYRWLLLSARQGHDSARQAVEVFRKQLTAEQRARSEAAAGVWAPAGAH
jgi:TPR repeat protein